MTKQLGELLTPDAARWLLRSAMRDARRQRENGHRLPEFALPLLAALDCIAAGTDTPAVASATPPRTLVPGDGPWVPVTEAADLAGLSASRLRALAKSGQVRARKIGRDWLIDPNSLPRRQDRAA